jgi:hypothetical protein
MVTASVGGIDQRRVHRTLQSICSMHLRAREGVIRSSLRGLEVRSAGVPVLKTGMVIRASPHGYCDCGFAREGARHGLRRSATNRPGFSPEAQPARSTTVASPALDRLRFRDRVRPW